jgi:hypothetical protein
VIVGGVPPPPDETLWEQSRFIASDGALRNFLNEPCGGVSGASICPCLCPCRRSWASASWGPATRHPRGARTRSASRPSCSTRTGCSARMATLSARGRIREGNVDRARSIIGSELICRIGGVSTIGSQPAIVPIVSSRPGLPVQPVYTGLRRSVAVGLQAFRYLAPHGADNLGALRGSIDTKMPIAATRHRAPLETAFEYKGAPATRGLSRERAMRTTVNVSQR